MCSEEKSETAKGTFYLTLCTGNQEADGPWIAIIANGGVGLMSAGESEFRSGPAALARGINTTRFGDRYQIPRAPDCSQNN